MDGGVRMSDATEKEGRKHTTSGSRCTLLVAGPCALVRVELREGQEQV
jgi:hypothetical protein